MERIYIKHLDPTEPHQLWISSHILDPIVVIQQNTEQVNGSPLKMASVYLQDGPPDYKLWYVMCKEHEYFSWDIFHKGSQCFHA